MKKFESFINENITKGILYIEQDDGQYDENWTMTIDVSGPWKDYYNKKTSLLDFNNQYADLLMEEQQQISSNVGDACWNEIEPVTANELRKATNLDQSETIYNKLYDIFDKYDIHIDTGKINYEENETS